MKICLAERGDSIASRKHPESSIPLTAALCPRNALDGVTDLDTRIFYPEVWKTSSDFVCLRSNIPIYLSQSRANIHHAAFKPPHQESHGLFRSSNSSPKFLQTELSSESLHWPSTLKFYMFCVIFSSCNLLYQLVQCLKLPCWSGASQHSHKSWWRRTEALPRALRGSLG